MAQTRSSRPLFILFQKKTLPSTLRVTVKYKVQTLSKVLCFSRYHHNVLSSLSLLLSFPFRVCNGLSTGLSIIYKIGKAHETCHCAGLIDEVPVYLQFFPGTSFSFMLMLPAQ